MPNRENILKWTAALRSGQYQQGKGALCRDGRFCCLGVACEVALTEGLPLEVIECDCPLCVSDTHDVAARTYDGETGILPSRVMHWLELESADPWVKYKGTGRHRLAELNDDGAFNFSEIADLIEQEFLTEDLEPAA